MRRLSLTGPRSGIFEHDDVTSYQGIAMFAELVPAAVGIALNPPAIIAVIVLLSAERPLSKAGAFVAGWLVGLLAVGIAVLAVGDAAVLTGGPTGVGIVSKIVLGAALLGLAVWQWRKSRAAGEEQEMPGWMHSLSGLTPPRAFVTAALFAGLNPKTAALNAAGALAISEARLSLGAQIVSLSVFVAVASTTVVAPLILYIAAGPRADSRLDDVRSWLVRHSAAITAVVLVVLGFMLISSGVDEILGA